MIGKRLNDYDQFAKRQTAADTLLLKSDAGNETPGDIFEKIAKTCDAADASERDAGEVLPERLQKSATTSRPIASTSSQLCRKQVVDDDKPAAGANQDEPELKAVAGDPDTLRKRLTERRVMGSSSAAGLLR